MCLVMDDLADSCLVVDFRTIFVALIAVGEVSGDMWGKYPGINTPRILHESESR